MIEDIVWISSGGFKTTFFRSSDDQVDFEGTGNMDYPITSREGKTQINIGYPIYVHYQNCATRVNLGDKFGY